MIRVEEGWVNAQILVIDDDPDLVELVERALGLGGFEVLKAYSGQEGIRMTYTHHPDLIILDVMMPEMSGWETCERLREMTDTPIIMATVRSSDDDKVRGFRLGVDDYVTKPYSLDELEMRIRAILKRTQLREAEQPKIYDDGRLRIDLESRSVNVEGKRVHLTPTEFRLLRSLIQNLGQVMSHDQLLTEAWGPTYQGATSSLALYIRYLREKLEEKPSDPYYIRTEWGVGYWFRPNREGEQEL
jgi:two-component system KDP operon response regulator KdpE